MASNGNPQSDSDAIGARLDVVKATDIAISAADEKRVRESVHAALRALAGAAPGSIFDTEPSNFDRVLANQAEGRGR